MLTRTRGGSQAGPNPILLSEILVLLQEEDIEHPDQRADVIHFIKNMDSEYCEIINEQIAEAYDRARRQAEIGRTRG